MSRGSSLRGKTAKHGTALLVCCAIFCPAAYARDSRSDAALAAGTIHQLNGAVNSGDTAALRRLLLPEGSVTDEFAPYHWSSIDRWLADYTTYVLKSRISHMQVIIVRTRDVLVRGDHAYGIADVEVRFSAGGATHLERGSEVYTFKRLSTGWRVNSLTWVRPPP